MTAAASPFFKWLTDMLKAISEWRTPFLDKAMSGVTWLGQETAFIIIGMIVLWCIDKKYGYRFLFMYMLGTWMNQMLKAIFMIPRPWVLDPELKIVESARSGATGWSFPSGHTQSAVVMYGGLARRIRKGWAYIAAVVLALLVGFSRMYLGVHTLLDVGVSLVTGVIVIMLTELIFNKIGDGYRPFAVVSGVVAALCLGLIVYIMTVGGKGELDETQVKDACVLFGTAFGLFAGAYIEKRFIDFDEKAKWWVQIIKVIVGVAIIIGLRVGLKSVLAMISDSPLTDIVRYFVMSFAAIAVYPLSFKLFKKKKA